jgi:hypothetical protein
MPSCSWIRNGEWSGEEMMPLPISDLDSGLMEMDSAQLHPGPCFCSRLAEKHTSGTHGSLLALDLGWTMEIV